MTRFDRTWEPLAVLVVFVVFLLGTSEVLAEREALAAARCGLRSNTRR